MGHALQQLAAFIVHFPRHAVSAEARAIARESLIDTIAVSIAGCREPAVKLAAAYVSSARSQEQGGVLGWADGAFYQPEAAALFNAVSAHALDYDDVTQAWRGHPGAVMWPALYAMASGQAPDLPSGRLLVDVLDAYVLGFELGAQIGGCLKPGHYLAGWHATCTVGVIAAAAACARIANLDVTQTRHALGLAIAQASGVQSNFGTSTKPFQVGFAASSAVRAVRLAALGVEASSDALTGRAGFCALYSGTLPLQLSLPTEENGAFAVLSPGVDTKHYPSCYATHRAIEAALALRMPVAVNGSDIVGICVEGSPGSYTPLRAGAPENADQARFSAAFCVASALVDGSIRLQSFTGASIAREAIQRLMARTLVSETPNLGPDRSARVSISLADGTRFSETITALPGRGLGSAYFARLRSKVDGCLEHAGLGEYSARLWDEIVNTSLDCPVSAIGLAMFQHQHSVSGVVESK